MLTSSFLFQNYTNRSFQMTRSIHNSLLHFRHYTVHLAAVAYPLCMQAVQ